MAAVGCERSRNGSDAAVAHVPTELQDWNCVWMPWVTSMPETSRSDWARTLSVNLNVRGCAPAKLVCGATVTVTSAEAGGAFLSALIGSANVAPSGVLTAFGKPATDTPEGMPLRLTCRLPDDWLKRLTSTGSETVSPVTTLTVSPPENWSYCGATLKSAGGGLAGVS